MRGAGSTYNDIVDRHIDAKVERAFHPRVETTQTRAAAVRRTKFHRRAEAAPALLP